MNSLWRVLKYARPYKIQVALSVICNVIMAFFTVVSIPALYPFIKILFGMADEQSDAIAFQWSDKDSWIPYLEYEFTEGVQAYGQDKMLAYVCIGIASLFFMKNFFRFMAYYFITPVRQKIVRDIRLAIFDKIMQLPIGYFSEQRKGDLISRSTSDVLEVETSILETLKTVFREPPVIIGALFAMIVISTKLLLFVLALMVFAVLVIGTLGRKLRRGSHVAQTRLGRIISTLEETLGGMRIIKAFSAEKYQREKFESENNSYTGLATKLLWQRELASPVSEFLGVSIVAVLLWYGSRLVFNGEMEPGMFLTFIGMFYLVIEPSKKFASASYHIKKGMAAVERIEEILDAPNPIMDDDVTERLDSFQHQIEFRDVRFKYDTSEDWVLDGINLSIPHGNSVALVGSSGAGKSTMADLLPRFYDVSEGGIFIDGKDIRNLSLANLRELMGVVSQEAILFNDSIYNNILFGMEGVSAKEVEEAARVANAHEFITQSENGYQTIIGDRGMKLSGGQRQRLTIARAVLRNPPILILDEATSALDSESEKLVQEALNNLVRGRTAILIAHRLSTIRHANEIVVLDNGRIIERGTHDQLLTASGTYARLVELQAV